MFTGISALSLDAKGRMTVPTRYRAQLMQADGATLALIESDNGCLLLMTQARWLERVGRLSEEDDDEERRRFWLGLSDTPEIDSAGRVLLDPVLREGAGISREVMLLGVGPHFEIWDAARLAAHKESVRARKFKGST
ncbi:MAG: cell division/cell wall cluster transcriptional repressor MraZ [Betaproteobacteria bacterium]|nr:cell division/cell wall cluster transcriptional repressor MraZ [Betaproteobacteria bacterium]